jgi:hypothetical protein
MKTKFLKLSAFTVVLIATLSLGVFFSCEDNANNLTSKKDITNKSTSSATASITYRCPGNCTADQSACGMIWDLKTGVANCSCEGCKLVMSDEVNSGYNFKMDLISIANYFIDYVYLNHNTFNYNITMLRESCYGDFEYLEIEYTIDNTEDIYTLVFVTEYTAEAPKGVVIVVDCTGSCSDGSCVEAFKGGEVYCKCQSDNCKMKIEKVEASYRSKYYIY